jgi:hypothetical protein
MKVQQKDQDSILSETDSMITRVIPVQAVVGFYSEADVMILIEALLALRKSNRDIYGKVNKHKKILAPKRTILEADGIDKSAEVNDLVSEISTMKPSQQILIPVIIPSQVHWVTLQIRCYADSTIHLRCYDSIGNRHEQEMTKLRDLLLVQLPEKTITVAAAQTPTIQGSDVYCGGYTARLISNLALNSQPVYTNINIWNCGGLRDQALRAEDFKIVNEAQPFDYQKFGNPDELSAFECKRNAQEASRARAATLQEKKTQIQQEIKTLDQDQILALKNTLELIQTALIIPLPRDTDPARHFLNILRQHKLDHTMLKKFIFRLDEFGELIRTDARGVVVLAGQEGDCTIQNDLEIEQIRELLRSTLVVVKQYKSPKISDAKTSEEEVSTLRDSSALGSKQSSGGFVANRNKAMNTQTERANVDGLKHNKVTTEEIINAIQKAAPSVKINFGNRHSIEVQFNEFCKKYNAYGDLSYAYDISLETKKRRILQDKEVF